MRWQPSNEHGEYVYVRLAYRYRAFDGGAPHRALGQRVRSYGCSVGNSRSRLPRSGASHFEQLPAGRADNFLQFWSISMSPDDGAGRRADRGNILDPSTRGIILIEMYFPGARADGL